jgi:hypothetical protein
MILILPKNQLNLKKKQGHFNNLINNYNNSLNKIMKMKIYMKMKIKINKIILIHNKIKLLKL